MPAADYPTLYDFETQLETAWDTVFEAASLTTYTQQASTDKTGPYVTVQATVGEAGRKYQTVSDNEIKGNILFGFTLEVQVVSNRTGTDAAANLAAHKTARGKVRHLLERWPAQCTGGSNINSQLSYIAIADMARSGGSRGVDEGRNFDITTETYSGQFQIKPDAWPT